MDIIFNNQLISISTTRKVYRENAMHFRVVETTTIGDLPPMTMFRQGTAESLELSDMDIQNAIDGDGGGED